MRRFGDLSLTRKLTVIIMVTTIAAMLLSAVAIISYQVHTFSKFIVSELTTTAEILGTNGAAALRFRMPRDAEITLAVSISSCCRLPTYETIASSTSRAA